MSTALQTGVQSGRQLPISDEVISKRRFLGNRDDARMYCKTVITSIMMHETVI